jgi:hypothetical protein
MAKHRVLAWFGFVEVILGAFLAWMLVGPQGLLGVCIAIAVSGAFCRGATNLVAGCRLLGVSIADYLLRVAAPGLAVAVPVVLSASLAIRALPPDSWLLLLGQCGLYGTLFAAGSLAVLRPEHRLLLLGRLWKKPVPA